jgi:hypothetical protein
VKHVAEWTLTLPLRRTFEEQALQWAVDVRTVRFDGWFRSRIDVIHDGQLVDRLRCWRRDAAGRHEALNHRIRALYARWDPQAGRIGP